MVIENTCIPNPFGTTDTLTDDETAMAITAGLSLNSWQRFASWLTKFLVFLERSGRKTPGIPANILSNNNVVVEFLVNINYEKKSRTRVAAAARAINFARNLASIPPISNDRRVSLIMTGARRNMPMPAKGARGLPGIMLAAVVSAWGSDVVWWKRMIATMMFTAFSALLRGAEVVGLPRTGVTWVTGLEEVINPQVIPEAHDGVLLLLPSRKTVQSEPSWAPIRSGKASALIRKHVQWARGATPTNEFLFPSRRFVKQGRERFWVPHPTNHISTVSFRTLIRKALKDVCGMSTEQAKAFSTHCFRVGGINYLARLGVPLETRAKLAGHKSLASSRAYLRALPAEQFSVLTATIGV